MNLNQVYDCLVTPLSQAKFYATNLLTWGHHHLGLQSFKYVYNQALKYKGCITDKIEMPIDNGLKQYNATELIKYYCTPDTFEIIDIITKQNLNAPEITQYKNINLTHTEQSLVINASKLFIEQSGLKEIFIPHNQHKIYLGYSTVNHTFEYYKDHPIFYGFNGDACSRENIFKFLFNRSVELVNELQNNFTNSSIFLNSEEENPYAQLINIVIGLTTVVFFAGIGYWGYNVYTNYTTNHSTNTYDLLPQPSISDSNIQIELAGISEDIITENANF